MVNWTSTIYNSLEELQTAVNATVNTSDIEFVSDPVTGRILFAKTA
jgi:hypothetical protein